MNPAQVSFFCSKITQKHNFKYPSQKHETKTSSIERWLTLSNAHAPFSKRKTGQVIKPFGRSRVFWCSFWRVCAFLVFGDCEFLFGKARFFVLHLCVPVWSGFPRTELMFCVYSFILPMNSFYGHWYLPGVHFDASLPMIASLCEASLPMIASLRNMILCSITSYGSIPPYRDSAIRIGFWNM